MRIPTYNLLSKNWDIFATCCCILLIFNPNYFRGGEVNSKRLSKLKKVKQLLFVRQNKFIRNNDSAQPRRLRTIFLPFIVQ